MTLTETEARPIPSTPLRTIRLPPNECSVLPDDELFDLSAGYDDEGAVELSANLTEEKRQFAARVYRLFNGLMGLCVVVGDPGTGKDLFGNYISYKIKEAFPWKRVLRDERPRPLYGRYAGLFNENTIQSDLSAMRRIAQGVGATRIDGVLDKAADDWVAGAGSVLLKGSLLYLTEYWRYCYKREPHNPMNKTMGAIHKVKRHLDNLTIGTAQMVEDLDKFTCKPWIDWKVICTHSATNQTGFVYWVQKVKYDKRLDVLVSLGHPSPISFDAGKPRSDLGDGKIVVRKHNYQPQTDEEFIVLEVLSAGETNYEKLVTFLEEAGDMCETDVLRTLKELKFRKSKRVLQFPCWFEIFNSKSAPQLHSSLSQAGGD